MKMLSIDKMKLTTYSGIAAALFAAENLNAQIAYTDIEPNILLDNMGSFSDVSGFIDMNNDGIADLELRSSVGTSNSSISNTGNVVEAIPLNHNKVENSVGFFGCFCDAEANDYGDVISSNNPGKKWKKFGYLYEFQFPAFNWSSEEHFVGIQLKKNADIYYGWVRLKVLGDGNPIEIMDYAYNTIPNQSITAGQTLGCADGFEVNNSFGSAKPLQTGHIYHGLINVGTDKDFFKWTYTADPLKPNVQVSLLDLPKNYNLRLYDASHALIATSATGGLVTEKIFYNNTLANGTYYIKVYPGSAGQFDGTNCYSLQIETRSTPYPKIGDAGSSAAELTSIKVFPNPAEDHITFLRTGGGFIVELRIMDASGREVLTTNPAAEQASVSVDIANLPAGTYFARITGTDELTVTKFVVQR
jgi:hypothetical protein